MHRKILIVDDVKINRDILKNILGDEYDFYEAESGQEAMTLMHRNYKFLSAILLDLNMPVMDGFNVLEKIRNNAVLAQIPVIVVTGDSATESEEKALISGACDYIAKPYNAVIVKQRIRNVINLRETSATVNSLQRDRLTGLFNREAFFDRVIQFVRIKPPGYYTLSSFNIDNFKIINDQYGTDSGDMILKHVADCIRRYSASVNGLCCRIMADHYAILYPSFYSDSELMEDTHRAIMEPKDFSHGISVRIGRYVIDDLSILPSGMYDRAALAERSIKGKYDTYIAQYEEYMRSKILHEQEIINDMDEALESRQFEVRMQPQYNHSTGALIGAEALVRWRHPQKGLISPKLFIPIFEQNGFIYEMDKYVWEEVCKNLRKWIDEGRNPLPVSVNISRYDIFCDDLVEVILELVNKYELTTDMLRLEITESAFVKSTEQIVKIVKELISYNFTVEIDDFGSGYSSLNTLKSVPSQVVKLDMKFLEENDESQRGGKIVESIVRMTKWLGMSVIAEGVEEKEQADFLKSIGCNYVQGYFYGKPMIISEYEDLCKSVDKEGFLKTIMVEHHDNNLFWDPKSMDTLIFNNYVGCACIFEYYQGKIEVLRATDKYIHMIEELGITMDEIIKLDWGQHYDLSES